MRKMLVLSIVTVAAAAAAGCSRSPFGSNSCLFGQNRHPQQYCQQPVECCDPCGGGAPAMMAPGAMMSPGPVMSPAPCCQ